MWISRLKCRDGSSSTLIKPGKTDRKEKISGNQLILSQNARISELHAQFLIEPTRPPCEMTTDDLSCALSDSAYIH